MSGNDKLFKLDLASGQEDADHVRHPRRRRRAVHRRRHDRVLVDRRSIPNQPIEPEVARNGNIYNIWTLNLKNGELQQFTDTLTGNVSPIVLRDQKPPKIAFVTYYKGEYGIHTLARDEPLHTVASADFGAPGPIIDFQPPLIAHAGEVEHPTRRARSRSCSSRGGRRSNVGVTSGGDLFGGTQVTFTDVLGDKQFNMFASSVSQYRTMSFSYINLSRRLQYALQGYSQTQFYYGYDPGAALRLEYALRRPRPGDRDADRARRDGFGIYPLNRYARARAVGRRLQYNQGYNDAGLQERRERVPAATSTGARCSSTAHSCRSGVAFVQETTVFREYGPLAGNTVRVGYEYAPGSAAACCRGRRPTSTRATTCASRPTACSRSARRGFKSWGEFPGYMYFGGNSELRGYDYLEFLGNKAFFANAELRFPLIEAALTPLGVIGGLRGVVLRQHRRRRLRGRADEGVDHERPSRVTPLLGFEPNFADA